MFIVGSFISVRWMTQREREGEKEVSPWGRRDVFPSFLFLPLTYIFLHFPV